MFMQKTHHPLIRTIYLYIFTLLGLVFLIIGAIRFLDMGLKVYVFTEAEKTESSDRYISTPCSIELTKIERAQDDDTFTDEEKESLKTWLAEYREHEKIDYVKANRHRDAATNLSFILVGLPLYLYHWHIIKKETKEQKEQTQIS